MIESGKSKNDVSLEAFPDGGVPLESILRTEELRHRSWHPPAARCGAGRVEQLDAFYKKELWLFRHDSDASANKQNRGDP